MTDVLENVRRAVPLETAERIVIEHLLVWTSDERPAEPTLMVKVWGVPRPFTNLRDDLPTVRFTYYLEHPAFAIMDDAL